MHWAPIEKIAPFAALGLTVALKVFDFAVATVQKKRDAKHTINVEEMRVNSSDMQFLVLQLREEVSRANKYFIDEQDKRRKTDDENEYLRDNLAVSKDVERTTRIDLLALRAELKSVSEQLSEARATLEELWKGTNDAAREQVDKEAKTRRRQPAASSGRDEGH